MRLARSLALLLVGSLLATVVAACGGDGEADRADSVGGVEVAQFDGVESGELELTLEIDDPAAKEEVNMRVLGPFLGAGEDELPQFDVALEAHGSLGGDEIEFSGGLLVAEDRIVVQYEGQTYQPPTDEFEAIRGSFEDAQDGGESDATACWDAAEEVGFDSFAKKLAKEGKGMSLDGTPVTYVGGDLEVPGLVEAIGSIAEDPSCAPQLEAVLPRSIPDLGSESQALQERVRDPHLVLAIDRKGVVREARLQVTLVSDRAGDLRKKLQVEFALRLNHVNEVTELPQPTGNEPLQAMFEKLGYDPLQALEAGEDDGLVQVLEAFKRRTAPAP